jgi:hypothetical protein
MKTTTDVPHALKEVWEWKDRVYKKLSHNKDKRSQIDRDTDEIIKRLGLKTLSR